MTFTTDQFKAALSEYDALHGGKESPLDILWHCYCVAAPQNDEPIRMAEGKLDPGMKVGTELMRHLA